MSADDRYKGEDGGLYGGGQNKLPYLGSRIYGGYADGRLNPEPYAYEGAFVVRWLIQSQLQADAFRVCTTESGGAFARAATGGRVAS